MATTTNYSWSTPDDTALVKDGALAIRTLGTAIDSTVFTNAGNAINKTIIDAKGDLIVGTAADTAARLAVGVTNGHVLQVDSSTASGLKWDSISAGGMTLINTGGTTLSGASTTISSIPATYVNLFIIVQNFDPSVDDGFLLLRYNSDSNARYYSAASISSSNLGFTDTAMYLNGGYDNGTSNSLIATTIYDYANTSTWKLCQTDTIGNHATTPTNLKYQKYFGAYNQTAAISSLTFAADSGTNSGGTVYVYGVK